MAPLVGSHERGCAVNYAEARALLPPEAFLSSTFGYPGVPGCSEYYRTADGTVYELTNEKWPGSARLWSVRVMAAKS